MRKLICLVLCAVLAAGLMPVRAEETEGPEWTFGVSLKDLQDTYLMPANAAEPLSEDYAPTDLEALRTRHNNDQGENDNNGIYTASSSTKISVRKAAETSLLAMFAAAEVDGVILYIKTGYRSYADQVKRYERARKSGDSSVDVPGQCDYQTGLGVGIVGKNSRANVDQGFADTAEYAWLKQHAAQYGFVERYPQGKEDVTGHAWEPWHFRYVGSGVAQYMKANNQCLEEFLDDKAAAVAAFEAAGGDMEEALAEYQLPEGPVQLKTTGPDGDHEIVLFHD